MVRVGVRVRVRVMDTVRVSAGIIIKVYSMVRGRAKVSIVVRGWGLMGRVYSWAKVRVRPRQCGFELGLGLELRLGLGKGRLGLGCSDIKKKLV